MTLSRSPWLLVPFHSGCTIPLVTVIYRSRGVSLLRLEQEPGQAQSFVGLRSHNLTVQLRLEFYLIRIETDIGVNLMVVAASVETICSEKL